MRKTVYLAVLLATLFLGWSGASDLWASPGQASATVPTRTPTPGPAATPRPPDPTATSRPALPSATPAPPTALPATAAPPTAVETDSSLPEATMPATLVALPGEQAPVMAITETLPALDQTPTASVPSPTYTAMPSATLAPTAATPTETNRPTLVASPTLVPASPTSTPVAAETRGPGVSPLLLAGGSLLVIGLLVAVGAGRRG